MDEWNKALITLLTGFLSGFLGGIWQSWIAKRNKLDESLFAKRKELYDELWPMTGKVPKYPRDTDFAASDAYALMNALRIWYFEKKGGLYMSSGTQKRYIAFQAALETASNVKGDKTDKEQWDKAYDGAQRAGSALRTGMTRDLQSRDRPNIF